MPRLPIQSPAAPYLIHTQDGSFVDSAGRTLLLRGVNLSGASKAPVGYPSHVIDDFWEDGRSGTASFVNRPLNLDDGSADIHLARLRGWGCNALRFPVTWEAIEHGGPGIYDEEFIQYTIRVLRKCSEYGFRVYMDPHQDTWSRFSGGSGAPYWTLPACGIDPSNITATQAAILHCEYPSVLDPCPSTLPAMIWSTNYGRHLSQTIFTLFFAGRDFAPLCIIDGLNIQDYLQSHFFAAMGHLADAIAAADNGALLDTCVIGWDSLNEPFEGLVGWPDLSKNPTSQGSTLKKGTYPTPIQSLRLGMGQAQEVDNWKFGAMGPKRDGSVTIDPKGRKIWADPFHPDPEDEDDVNNERSDGFHPRWGWKRDVSSWSLGTCIWAMHGVWDVETGYLLRPDYFKYNPSGAEVEFIVDYWRPFFTSYAERIRAAHPRAVLFVQPPVFAPPPPISEEILQGRAVYAPHYYDGLTLVTRHWNWFNADALGLLRGKYRSPIQALKIGEKAIRKSIREQLGILRGDSEIITSCKYLDDDGNNTQLNARSISSIAPRGIVYPTLLGEIGTPFDMDGKRAYTPGKALGDYSRQIHALDASLNGCDGAKPLNYTVWNYCPDSSHVWGDQWNMEDLSLWCADDLGKDYENEEDQFPMTQYGGRGVRETDEASLWEAGHSRLGLLSAAAGQPTHSITPSPSISTSTLSLDQDRERETAYPPRSPPTRSISLGQPLSLAPQPSYDMFLPHDERILPKCQPGSMENSNIPSRLPLPPGPRIPSPNDDPLGFLTAGGRATRAFARPWPICVVGRATSVEFDVKKSVFRLIIRVGADDAPIQQSDEYHTGRDSTTERSSTSKNSRGSKDEGDPKARVQLPGYRDLDDSGFEGPPATEVFVPLVHYAKQSLFDIALAGAKDAASNPRKRRRISRERRQGGNGETHNILLSANDGDVSSGREFKPPLVSSNVSSSSTSTVLSGGSEETAAASTSTICTATPTLSRTLVYPPPPPPLLHTISNSPDLLALDVSASTGRWAVRGQTLRWWYDIPEEGEPDREYVLEIRRVGGAMDIDLSRELIKEQQKAKSARDKEKFRSHENERKKDKRGNKVKSVEDEQAGCCSRLWGEGCCIM